MIDFSAVTTAISLALSDVSAGGLILIGAFAGIFGMHKVQELFGSGRGRRRRGRGRNVGYRNNGYRRGGYRRGGYRKGGYRKGGYRKGGYKKKRQDGSVSLGSFFGLFASNKGVQEKSDKRVKVKSDRVRQSRGGYRDVYSSYNSGSSVSGSTSRSSSGPMSEPPPIDDKYSPY